ncbi:MAG: (d)CMP kinase [Clostridia bacterium]
MKYIIAVDGVSATGKSTISKEVANRLNILYIDTGAMYRAVSYYFYINNIYVNEENAIKHMNKINIELKFNKNITEVYLNNINITDKIRSNEVTKISLEVSKIAYIRKCLVEKQRILASNNSVILEGRDISSVVFPNAFIKIYLECDIYERAKRRKIDFDKQNEIYTIDEIIEQLKRRDESDISRKESPLIKVSDAILIDTTNLTILQVVDKIIDIVNKKIKENK